MNVLERAQHLLDQGQEQQARALVLRYRLLPGQSPEEYLGWGKLCEELSLPKHAAECYQKALAKDPHWRPALLALAQLYYEIGDLYAAKKLALRRLRRDPHDQEAKDLLVSIHKELGEIGPLKKLCPEKVSTEKPPEERFFPRSFGPRELDCLEEFLYGRQAYKEEILNPKTGESVFLFRAEPLSKDLLRAHLSGQKYLYAFPISEGLKIRWACFHLEIPYREVLRHWEDKSWFILKLDALYHAALKAFKRLKELGLPAACEHQSPHIIRFIFLFAEPIHFLWAKRFLEHLKGMLPYPEDGIFYRPFNLTRPEGNGWRENALPLPLGTSPIYEVRAFLLDENMERIGDDLAYFKKLRRLSLKEIKSFCRGQELCWKPESKRASILERLYQGCPLIAAIAQKAEAGARLTRHEKLALFLTVGLLDPEGRLLHELLQPTPDYRYTRVERQRRALPPNPISCYKLREWFPGLAAVHLCGCAFEDTGYYPSPLLHVRPELVGPGEEVSLKTRRPEELGRFYRHLLAEQKRLSEKISRLERELKDYLLTRPGRKIKLKDGEYLVLKEGQLALERKAR